MFAEDRDEEDVFVEPILAGWQLIKVDDQTMEIQLNFTDPISVSAGDVPDLVFVQIDPSQLQSAKNLSLT